MWPTTVPPNRSFRDPSGRLVNISLDMARHQGRVSLPWRFGVPSRSGLVPSSGHAQDNVLCTATSALGHKPEGNNGQI